VATLAPPEQGEAEDEAEYPQPFPKTECTEELARIGRMLQQFQSWDLPLMSFRECLGSGSFAYGDTQERKERASKRKFEESLADGPVPECPDRLAIFEGRDEQDLLVVQAPPPKRQRTRMEEIYYILSMGDESPETSDRDSEERGPVHAPEVIQASPQVG
jgi:hypothetical protein